MALCLYYLIQSWKRRHGKKSLSGTLNLKALNEETEDIKFEEELGNDMDEEEQDRAGVETLVDSGTKR